MSSTEKQVLALSHSATSIVDLAAAGLNDGSEAASGGTFDKINDVKDIVDCCPSSCVALVPAPFSAPTVLLDVPRGETSVERAARLKRMEGRAPVVPVRGLKWKRLDAVRGVMAATTYYEILGISEKSQSPDQWSEYAIDQAYKRLAVLVHPDQNPSKNAAIAFRRVSASRDYLQKKRQETQVHTNALYAEMHGLTLEQVLELRRASDDDRRRAQAQESRSQDAASVRNTEKEFRDGKKDGSMETDAKPKVLVAESLKEKHKGIVVEKRAVRDAGHSELRAVFTRVLTPGARVSIDQLNQRPEFKKVLKPVLKKHGLRLNRQTVEIVLAGKSGFAVEFKQGVVWVAAEG